MIRFLFLAFIALINSSISFAVIDITIDKGKIVSLHPSNRDQDNFAKYQVDIPLIFNRAIELNYNIPDHQEFYFVGSEALGLLSAMGRYPLPHWHDGQMLTHSLRKISGVLEFVTMAKSKDNSHTARSYYTDLSDYVDQIEVLMHVAGHNDFGINSGYTRMGNTDQQGFAYDLSFLIKQLIEDGINYDEINLFVQFLYSLTDLQDFVQGYYMPPESFKKNGLTNIDIAKKNEKAFSQAQLEQNLGVKIQGSSQSFHTSPHVFSYIVYQMLENPNIEEWKKQIIVYFEKMVRHYSGNIQTKIMNEGWATYSEMILWRNMPRFNDNPTHISDMANTFGRVSWPSLQNPYWLGLQCWQNRYRLFRESYDPINRPLYDKKFANNPDAESFDFYADKHFVTKAHEVILTQGNSDFIRSSIDESWLTKNKLALVRKATDQEVQDFCGNNQSCYPDPQKKQVAMIVLSRNTQRIVQKIIRTNSDYSIKIPRIVVELNSNYGPNVLSLKHQHFEDIQLEWSEMIQTLYVMALTVKKSVSLKTIVNSIENKTNVSSKVSPARVVVHLDGSIDVFMAEADMPSEDVKAVKLELKKILDAYIEDTYLGQHIPFDPKHDVLLKSVMKKVNIGIDPKIMMEDVHGSVGTVPLHAENKNNMDPALLAGDAFLAYTEMLQSRFSYKLQQAILGKTKVTKTNKGVRFNVMPNIPSISLDQRIASLRKQTKKPAPVDNPDSTAKQFIQASDDDDAILTPFEKGIPGDIFIIQQPDGKKGQNGEEGEEGEDGEEGNGDGDEEGQPGGQGKNPSEVELDLKEWGTALQNEIALPNTRRTREGQSEETQRQPSGYHMLDRGYVNWSKTIPNIFLNGMMEDFVDDSKELTFNDPLDTLLTGLTLFDKKQQVVRAFTKEPLPAFKAVVVVAMDFSGSMQGLPHKMVANVVFNLKALLMAKYTKVDFRFIVYDDKAYEFKENEIFGKKAKFLGGGTSNVAGFELASKVLDEYEYSQWNKYFLWMGDAGASDGDECIKISNKIYPQAQYMAYVYTNAGVWGDDNFLKSLQAFADKNQWAGYTEMKSDSQQETLRVLKDIFRVKQVVN